MQTLEAILSFFFFVLITSAMLYSWGYVDSLDYSLYRMQLAGDVWRVLYLRGSFDNLWSIDSFPESAHQDAERIEELTGLRVYIAGLRLTSHPGGPAAKEDFMMLNKVLVVGSTPKNVTFSLKR